jgi:hypothetical protein
MTIREAVASALVAAARACQGVELQPLARELMAVDA